MAQQYSFDSKLDRFAIQGGSKLLTKLVQTLPTEFPEPVVIEKNRPTATSFRSPHRIMWKAILFPMIPN